MIIKLYTNFYKLNLLSLAVINRNVKNYSLFFNIIFMNKKSFIFFSNFHKMRLSWINFNKNFNKNTFISYESFYYNLNAKKTNTLDILENIIVFKKKNIILKKNLDYNYIFSSRVSLLKNNYDNLNKFFQYKKKIKSKGFSIKTVDMFKKIRAVIDENRSLMRKHYNIKYYRRFSLSKNIVRFCNMRKKQNIFYLENSLENILMKSDFFFNLNDCKWFIKNGLISINSKVNTSFYKKLKQFDIINISFSSFYYNFYKKNLEKIIINMGKLNLKLWTFNQIRFKNIKKKNSKKKDNNMNWLNNYKYLKRDIPLSLEIDYLSMTIVFLDYNINYHSINYYNIKFISLYLNRLYNWKNII